MRLVYPFRASPIGRGNPYAIAVARGAPPAGANVGPLRARDPPRLPDDRRHCTPTAWTFPITHQINTGATR
jgi:hypothetical protein